MLCKEYFGKTSQYQWLGRFDLQVNTKFNLDNTSNQSFLILGYEPAEVKSELYILDYIELSLDQGIESVDYFDKFNPIFGTNVETLRSNTTRVLEFNRNLFKIVLINNSNCKQNYETLDIQHKAIKKLI